MLISFTGTRKGMTHQQINTFTKLLFELGAEVLIHGDCIGADADAHVLAMGQEIEVRKRPCNLQSQRAFTDGGIIIAEPEPPLDRNVSPIPNGLRFPRPMSWSGPAKPLRRKKSNVIAKGNWQSSRFQRKLSSSTSCLAIPRARS